MEFRKKGAGAWKDSVKNAVAVPSLPIIGHPLRNDLQTAPRSVSQTFLARSRRAQNESKKFKSRIIFCYFRKNSESK